MNRTLFGWAAILAAFAVGLMVSPIPMTGAESLTPLAEIGVFIIPIAVVVAIAAGTAVDPDRLTLSGALGSPDENDRIRRHPPAAGPMPARLEASPREPVNCRRCYTLVAWNVRDCPRCRTPRDCRNCGGELDGSGAAIGCVRCGRAEAICRCAPRPRARVPSEHTRRRAVR